MGKMSAVEEEYSLLLLFLGIKATFGATEVVAVFFAFIYALKHSCCLFLTLLIGLSMGNIVNFTL